MKRNRYSLLIACILLLPFTGLRCDFCNAAVPQTASSPDASSASGKSANPATDDPEKVKPAPASTGSFCYGWKPGHSYTYRVMANTQLADFEEDLDGTVVYTVESIDSEGVARVACSESFSHSRKSRSATDSSSTEAGRSSSFEHHSSRMETTTVDSAPARITIDRYGRITETVANGNPPFSLCQMSRLAIEPLSALNKNTWTIGGDVSITLAPQAGMFPLPPPLGGEAEALAAHEKTTYVVKNSDSTNILLDKTYKFATNEEVDGKPRLSMTGEGELTFDRQNGIFKSSKMEIQVTLYENGIPLKMASMVNCVLSRVTAEPNKP